MPRPNVPDYALPDVVQLKTSTIQRFCDPFKGCWIELNRPLSTQDVQRCLDRDDADLQEPWRCVHDALAIPQAELRRRHAAKVAWFVLYGFQDPIQLDVGVPSLGCYPSWLVQDGNHRLAAAIFRRTVLQEDPMLPVEISGSISFAKELGLL